MLRQFIKALAEQLYYDYITNSENAFLRSWFAFEQKLKNIITVVMSNKLELKPKNEMIGDKATVDEIIFYMEKNFDLNHLVPNYQKLAQIRQHPE